jgi:hypothetical protein
MPSSPERTPYEFTGGDPSEWINGVLGTEKKEGWWRFRVSAEAEDGLKKVTEPFAKLTQIFGLRQKFS